MGHFYYGRLLFYALFLGSRVAVNKLQRQTRTRIPSEREIKSVNVGSFGDGRNATNIVRRRDVVIAGNERNNNATKKQTKKTKKPATNPGEIKQNPSSIRFVSNIIYYSVRAYFRLIGRRINNYRSY